MAKIIKFRIKYLYSHISPVNLWFKFKLIATKAFSAKYEASK